MAGPCGDLWREKAGRLPGGGVSTGPAHHGGQDGQEEGGGGHVANALGEGGSQETDNDGNGRRWHVVQWRQFVPHPVRQAGSLWAQEQDVCEAGLPGLQALCCPYVLVFRVEAALKGRLDSDRIMALLLLLGQLEKGEGSGEKLGEGSKGLLGGAWGFVEVRTLISSCIFLTPLRSSLGNHSPLSVFSQPNGLELLAGRPHEVKTLQMEEVSGLVGNR